MVTSESVPGRLILSQLFIGYETVPIKNEVFLRKKTPLMSEVPLFAPFMLKLRGGTLTPASYLSPSPSPSHRLSPSLNSWSPSAETPSATRRSAPHRHYRGTSLIRNPSPVGPYSSFKSRDLG